MPAEVFAQDPARPPDACVRRLTHALLNPATAAAAATALAGIADPAAVEGLAELLADPPSATAALAALASLEGRDGTMVREALVAALDSPHASVRAAAVEALHHRSAMEAFPALARLLARDPSWVVRRAALRTIAYTDDPD
jgi:HEAT repeat protein